MDIRHVWSIAKTQQYRGERWGVWTTDQEGKNHVHVFEPSHAAHIAAAYSVDMSNESGADEVLDIILHQPFIPNLDDPSTWDRDIAFQKGYHTQLAVDIPNFSRGTKVPISLYTAESPEQAREVHLLRIDEAKKVVKFIPYTDEPDKLKGSAAQMYLVTTEIEKKSAEHPWKAFRENHGVRQEDINTHLQLVEHIRQGMRGKLKEKRLMNSVEIDEAVRADLARRYLAAYRDKKNTDVQNIPDWVKASLPDEFPSA